MSDASVPEVVRAAGCVLWRPHNGLEVAVIHRPKHDDWSLPKGKIDPGETPEQAALRELEEETGYRGELGAYLGLVEYLVERKGTFHPKTVHYWNVEAHSGGFAPNDEVDALRWLPVGDARLLLSHDRDRGVLDWFAAQPPSVGDTDRQGRAGSAT